MNKQLTRSSLITVIAAVVIASASGCGQPNIRLKELAVKAGYTNVEIVTSSDKSARIVSVRVGQCPVRIYFFKDEHGSGKFDVRYRMPNPYINVNGQIRKYVVLNDDIDLMTADEAVTVLTNGKIAQDRKKQSADNPEQLCDATKPYNKNVDRFKY